MNRAIWPAVVRAFRRAALPLACYYAVTLALPLANGAAQAGATFVAHSLVVLVVPLVLIMLGGATHHIASRLTARRHLRTLIAERIGAPPVRGKGVTSHPSGSVF